MNKIKLMAIMVMAVASNVLFVGCGDKNNPTGPVSTAKNDTSIFIGSWAEVFDTSDNPTGSKEAKIIYWTLGGIRTPDTTSFLNDSMEISLNSQLEYYYSYSKDSIYTYSFLRGSNTHEFIGASWYKISNDTLFGEPATYYIGGQNYVYYPMSIKISSIPIQPKVMQ